MADDNRPPEKQSDQRHTQREWAVQGYLVRFPTRRFVPPTDIIELEDRIIVLVEIAGIQTDGFKIALYNQRLTVNGRRERPPMPDAAYHQAEIGFGDFEISIPMPWSVQYDSVTASYKDGFLRIELPRQQARRVHIVDVNTEED